MAKFKVGDRICIVNPADTYGEYEAGDEGEITSIEEKGVSVFFDHYEEGCGSMYVRNEEYEVIATDGSKTTAESLRNSILDIRSKREALQKEILLLDDQEKETVEKLKEHGFVLYEDNVSKESVIIEKKVMLYAEDIEEDMTNPKNWVVGDLLERIQSGAIYEVTFKSVARIEYGKVSACPDAYLLPLIQDEDITWLRVHYKFHSRPVK